MGKEEDTNLADLVQTVGAEPKYGAWPEGALRQLIYLTLAKSLPNEYSRYSSQQRLAMSISQRTGCAYNFALREIEHLAGCPRA